MWRILPLTLIAVFMVLPIKISLLSEGFPAVAEKFDREFGAHERPWARDINAEAAARPPEEQAAEPAQPAAVPPGATQAPVTIAKACDDPALVAAVDAQKSDLAQRSRHVVEAEAVLAATEARAATEIRRLSDMKRDVEALLDKRSKMQAEDLRRMVTIYQVMKPQDAARILSSLDAPIIVDVLDGMAERRSAPILAELEDAKARDVTRLILERRMLPGDRQPDATADAIPHPVTATN